MATIERQYGKVWDTRRSAYVWKSYNHGEPCSHKHADQAIAQACYFKRQNRAIREAGTAAFAASKRWE